MHVLFCVLLTLIEQWEQRYQGVILYIPGLNIVIPLRYAYSFGLKSKLQNFLRQDLSLLTPAMVGFSLSISGLSWRFRRIFFSMLSAGLSVTSKSTCSWARPKIKSGAQQLLTSTNWSCCGSWLNAGRFFMKWSVLTRTAEASLQISDGLFKHTFRCTSQLHLWGVEV